MNVYADNNVVSALRRYPRVRALERGGVVAGPGRVQEGARAVERDPARRVVQLGRDALRTWLDSWRGIGAVEPNDQRPGSCRLLAIVTCRNSTMRRRNSVGVNGFGMKPMHPARTSAFAWSAVPEVRATTGILRVTGSARSFSITASPSMPGI